MATLYIKEKATGVIMMTVAGHTENSPEAKITIDDFLDRQIDEGRTADEFEAGITDDNTVNEWIEQQTEDQKTYVDRRQEEYPDTGDQFDMLWHAIDEGTLDKTSNFYTVLKAAKDKYPKE